MTIAAGAFLIAGIAGLAYLACAIWRIAVFRRRRAEPVDSFTPAITILKPLCGLEPQLYENLSSFCDQDYPEFQVIFGIQDSDDPATEIVKRVIERFRDRDTTLVVDNNVRGSNLKIANILNMIESAKHDVLLVADSDTRVGPAYLRSVVAPFANDHVGAVTCLYRGVPCDGLVSELGAMFIGEQFIPSVLVAVALSPLDFCLGATMAVTRRALEKIGGFEALSSHLADDQMLGKLVTESGLSVELSSYLVENLVGERSLKSLWAHELRWARAMFAARPWGYTFSFIMHALPISLIYLALVRNFSGVLLASLALALRLALHYAARSALRERWADAPWLIPVRDLLSLAEWAASFFQRKVLWRDREFSVDAAGRMEPRQS